MIMKFSEQNVNKKTSLNRIIGVGDFSVQTIQQETTNYLWPLFEAFCIIYKPNFTGNKE